MYRLDGQVCISRVRVQLVNMPTRFSVNEDGELSIDEFVKGCLEDGELMMFTVRYLPLQWYLPDFKRNLNISIYLWFHFFFENSLQKRQRYFIRSNVWSICKTFSILFICPLNFLFPVHTIYQNWLNHTKSRYWINRSCKF